jgi:hypothetical protein
MAPPPYGYEYRDGSLLPVAREQRVIARVRELSSLVADEPTRRHLRRYSDTAIAFILNSEGERNRRGTYWSTQSVANVRRADIYRQAVTAGAADADVQAEVDREDRRAAAVQGTPT